MTIYASTARPLIGAIARDLEDALPRDLSSSSSPTEERQVAAIFLDFDRRHGSRPDYRLWRKELPHYSLYHRARLPNPHSAITNAWPDWADTALQGAESNDPRVIWSLIAIAPELIERRQRQGEIGDDAPIVRFADRLHDRLRGGLLPLETCPASCGVAAALFLIRHQNLHHRAGRNLTINGHHHLFAAIGRWLQLADKDWRPGRTLNMSAVRKERHGFYLLRARPDDMEFSLLTTTLGILRSTLSTNIHYLTARSEKLLQDAYAYALTAWLTARSRRAVETLYQDRTGRRGRPSSEGTLLEYFHEEFDAHLAISSAARDAGDYMESAKYLYLLYRLIPDKYREDSKVVFEFRRRKGLIRYLKEAGLEVDPRFNIPRDDPRVAAWMERVRRNRAAKWPGLPLPDDHWSINAAPLEEPSDEPAAAEIPSEAPAEDMPPENTPPDAPEPETGFALRVRRDQQGMLDWKTVNAEIEMGLQKPVGHLLTVTKGLADRLPASPEVILAGCRLALRYGYVRTAGEILERVIYGREAALPRPLLKAFVNRVRQCTQLDPFGLDLAQLAEWQALIRAGCAQLQAAYGRAWADGKTRLLIHETLINRTHAQHKSLSRTNARRLYEKSAGVYDVGELRAFYENQYNFRPRAPGVARVEDVAARLREHAASPIGAPVAVSVMQMGDSVSIVAVGASGKTVTEDRELPGLVGQTLKLTRPEQVEHWFKKAGAPADRQISWPRSLRELAARICQTAAACDPEGRVLLLSLDTALAQLPWQHLVSQTAAAQPWLVAIVPNLSAFVLMPRAAQDTEAAHRILLSTEPDPPIARIAAAVQATVEGIDPAGAGLFIAAGHGEPAGEGLLPAMRVGGGGGAVIDTLDGWMDIVGARVSIFHVCHSGISRPLFMEEFGGIAGLAICLGARVILAPVAEVLSSTAVTLQQCLFEDPRRAVGASYLAAIARDPGCTLYTLYGSPYEVILPPATACAVRSAA